MSDVSVIGTGVMGSAFVEALAASGAGVTVWNRTREKAEALAGERVRVADTVAEALSASPLSLLMVPEQQLSRTLVEGADADLRGRVIASASFVTPDQARAYAAVVEAAGGHYLDLAIPAYPSEVRSRSGVFLVSGHRSAFEVGHAWFDRIGRRTTYVGDAPGDAFVSEMAVLLAYLPMAVGLLQGLRVCEHYEISSEWFAETVLELYPRHIRSLLDRLAEEPDPLARRVEASIDEWGRSAAEYGDSLRGLGLDAEMYEALNQLFRAVSEAGHGDADWTGVAELAPIRDRT